MCWITSCNKQRHRNGKTTGYEKVKQHVHGGEARLQRQMSRVREKRIQRQREMKARLLGKLQHSAVALPLRVRCFTERLLIGRWKPLIPCSASFSPSFFPSALPRILSQLRTSYQSCIPIEEALRFALHLVFSLIHLLVTDHHRGNAPSAFDFLQLKNRHV